MKKNRIGLCCLYDSTSNFLLKMKLLTFLIFVSVASVTANSYSQQTKFNLSLENITVRQAFKEIENHSEFIFLYSEKSVDVNRKVDVKVENESVEKILDQVFKGTGNFYEIHDRQIAIMSNDAPEIPVVLKNPANAEQKKELSGTVKDSKELPLPGVTVYVKGSTMGTITDNDGRFRISVPTDAQIIMFSFVGMKSQEFPIAGKTTFNVVMEEVAVEMGDVVVVAYGTQKKATMTGSVISVSSKDLLKTPVANMAAALIGRTPGLTTYNKSGQPGNDGITLRIRGIETTNGANPLILVDGVERDFTQLDPNEIESISILKDAATTAVFGVRGANGVIIVTTKKGVEGPAKISFTSNFSIQQPTRLPKMIGAETFCRMYNEAQINDVPTAIPRFSEADIQKYISKENLLEYPNNDWISLSLKPSALQQQHNLNISGGTKSTRYYTSIGYFNQEGLMHDFTKELDNRSLSNNYKYNRFNLRSNIEVDLTPTTKIGVMVSGIISKTLDPGFSWGGLLSVTPVSFPIAYDHKVVVSSINFAPSPIRGAIGQSIDEKSSNTLALTVNFNQKLDFISNGLSFRGMTSYDSYYAHNIARTQGYTAYLVDYLPDAKGNVVRQLTPAGEEYLVTDPSESWGRNRKTHTEAALEYKRSFDKHNIGGLVLTTFDKKWYTTGISDKYYSIPMSYSGLVGRFTYDYSSRYLLEFNMGYNGSENFPASKRFAWFPAVSTGWNLTEESFFKNLISPDILDKLKIRGSFGVVGNDATASGFRFLYLDSEYSTGGGAMFGDGTPVSGSGYIEGKLGNPAVTWETATKQDIGLELSMFNSKLTFTGDIFRSDRKNILTLRNTLPVSAAMATQDYYNLGRINNHGFEMEVRWRQNLGKFSYYLGGNYSFARNKILEIDEVKDPLNPNLWRTGQRLGQNFGLIADGFFNSADEIARGPVMGNPGLGDTRYIDINGDGIVSMKDLMPIGNPEFPEINYGIDLGGSFKGFDLSFLFQGATNTSKMMGGYFQKPFDVNGGMMDFTVAERWTPENALNAVRPRLTLNYANPNSYLSSTLWLRDGSYLRLRNVEFAYRFDRKLIKKLFGLDGLRIYANGQNLFTWDKLKVVDPEADANGSWTYPQEKIYNIGIKIDF
jgi:TonB-linked SusC/RagA family outer membrane protein